jgi:methyl-accepting chemotaxis protein
LGSQDIGELLNDKGVLPILEDVEKLNGCKVAILQRMNEAGEMLKVTSSRGQINSEQATALYIPSQINSSQINPITSALLMGKNHIGRELINGNWYLTGYKPLFDSYQNLIGALFVALPHSSDNILQKTFNTIRVGETGYVYFLQGSGAERGTYIISEQGKRNGENIYNAADESGTYFIQEIIAKALLLNPDQIADHSYQWKNVGDTRTRTKLVKIKYFAPWDWVIGAGSFEEEFYKPVSAVLATANNAQTLMIIAGLLILAIAIITWIFVARQISNSVLCLMPTLTRVSRSVNQASKKIAHTGGMLADNTSKQATSIEQISASLEELTNKSEETADNSRQANTATEDARKMIEDSKSVLADLLDAIEEMKQSADSTASINRAIDEIAFQTNLLALNAAVEAARAGEAGKGFAVVAEEVRSLAQRTSQAAQNSNKLISETIHRSQRGVEIASETAENLTMLSEKIDAINALITDISNADLQQKDGVQQINQAVCEIDSFTQQTANEAEQTAQLSFALQEGTESMREAVRNLEALISSNGNGNGKPLHGKAARLAKRKSLQSASVGYAVE